MNTNIRGGWTPYRTEISSDEIMIFNEVMDRLKGTKYTPLSVATQFVEGTNYRFFCNAKGDYANALNEASIVEMYLPINGKALVTFIKSV